MPDLRSSSRLLAGRLRDAGRDFRVAAILYTRVPLAREAEIDGDALARAQWAAPLVGAAIGLGGAAGFALAAWLALPPAACALAALATTIAVTGALHEDGLADTADGLGGGRGRAEKMRIMRDSRIGSYGALALILGLGLRAAALTALAQPAPAALALVGAGALSRGVLPAAMAWSTPARADGLAAAAGRLPAATAWAAAGISAVIAMLTLGPPVGLVALLAAAAAAVAVVGLAVQQIGGHTGDILGALQQVAEAAVLLAAAAAV